MPGVGRARKTTSADRATHHAVIVGLGVAMCVTSQPYLNY